MPPYFSLWKNQPGREALFSRWGARHVTWITRPIAPLRRRSVANMADSLWSRSL